MSVVADVATLKLMLPEFANVSTPRIQLALDVADATTQAENWDPTERAEYVILRAAHKLATSQQGMAVRKDGSPIRTLYSDRIDDMEAVHSCLLGRS